MPDLDTAFRRIRDYSYPKENNRWHEQGLASMIGKTLVLEREYAEGRATVVLVREAIGF